jgi:hypothetical protein
MFNGQNFIGIKAVIYDVTNPMYNPSNITVRVQQWVDDQSNNNAVPGNHWHKVLDYIDSGQWGPTRLGVASQCGGTEHQIASWGGPIALIRWDNINSMDLKWASVREINPPN